VLARASGLDGGAADRRSIRVVTGRLEFGGVFRNGQTRLAGLLSIIEVSTLRQTRLRVPGCGRKKFWR
jgi:hypothetical protein